MNGLSDSKAAAAQTVLAALQAGTYQSPAVPTGGVSVFDPGTIMAIDAASVTLEAAEQAGNITQAHADLDALNKLKASQGQAPAGIASDFTILQNAPGAAGDMARWIASQVNASGADTTDPAMLLTPATVAQAAAAVDTRCRRAP